MKTSTPALLALAAAHLAVAAPAARAQTAQPGAAPPPAAAAEPAPTAADLARAIEAARAAAEAARAAAEAANAAAQAARAAAEAVRDANAAKAAPAPAPGAPAPAPAKPAAPPPWTYKLSVNLLAVSGNATSATGQIIAAADGKWDPWSAQLRAGATYGQTQSGPSAPSQITAYNANGSARGDRAIIDKFTVYLLAGATTDRIASIEWQALGEAGLSMTWWQEMDGEAVRSSLRTDLGLRYTHEARRQFFPTELELRDVEMIAPRAAVALRYAISKAAVFTEEAEILPDLLDLQNVRFTSATTLSAQIEAGLGLAISFKLRSIGRPAPGKLPVDTELSAGITWGF